MGRMLPRVMLAMLPLVLGGCMSSVIAATNGGDLKAWSHRMLGIQPAAQAHHHAVPLYCYRTLGVEDCHAVALPGEETRLQGFVGPAPLNVHH